MSADIALKKDIARSLRTLNEMYFIKQDHPYMGGASHVRPDQETDTTIFPNPTLNNTNFSNRSNLTYYLFGNQYQFNGTTNYTPPFFKVNAPNANTFVYVLKKNGETSFSDSYSIVRLGQWETNILDMIATAEDSVNDVVDINVWPLLTNDTEKMLLNALYALYDLTSDTKWPIFQNMVDNGSYGSMQVKIANIGADNRNKTARLDSKDTTDGANINYILGENWATILTNLADNEKFVPFALRRLMYLYIRNFQFNIALSLVNKAPVPANGTDYLTPSSILAQSIFALLESDIITLKDDTNVRMAEGVANRIQRYNSFTRSINDINDTYGETKDYVKANSERLDSETKYEKKASVMMYVAVAILFVSLAVSFVSVGLNMDVKQKLMIAGGSAAFASIAGLVLFVVFTKQVVEGFAPAPRTAFASGKFTRTMTNDVKEKTITEYKLAILELSRDYIQYITTLIQTITSYRSFGNVTYSMAKEYRYYVDHNTTLKNTGDKYRAGHRASDLYQKKYGASMYLCVLLAIVCSIMAIAYIWVGQNAAFLQPFVLGVGGVAIFIIFVIYIMEITGYVRTDGDKKYWGKPNPPQ